MFGLFDSDLKRVRKLRLEYEDIRQRVLHKMNGYQQYSFLSGYRAAENQYQEFIEAAEGQSERWLLLGSTLKEQAQSAWSDASRRSGIDREGLVAGLDGLALLALRCTASGYQLTEALILKGDILAFEAQIDEIVERQRPSPK